MNYSEQLAAWAIDRAIETFKLTSEADRNIDADGVIEVAKKYATYVGEVAEQYEAAQKAKGLETEGEA